MSSKLPKIGISEALLGKEEQDALCEVIQSEWISSGEKVDTFEKTFAAMHSMEEAVAVSSCTSGLHMALEALDIGKGDEVLIPGITFVATVNAVLYSGAKPVPVDIASCEIPHIAIKDAESRITSKTKAVIVMHYGGYIVDLSAWKEFCSKHNLKLIEDAAHTVCLHELGKDSDAAVFSFFANKNMTTAEGGMVISQHPEVCQRVRNLRAHGMTTSTLSRAHGHAFTYDVIALGYNNRMDELRAAVGLAQLSRLNAANSRRMQLAARYRQLFAGNAHGVTPPFDGKWTSSFHLMPILLPEGANRQDVMQKMLDSGIQTSIHYPLYHKFTWHSSIFPQLELPVSEAFYARELTLPLHPGLRDEDVARVVSSLFAALSSGGAGNGV